MRIIDDYAHHPTEIKATLDAASKMNYKKMWVIFQPHTYTRTLALCHEFGHAFKDADIVVLGEIYAAREKNIHKLSSKTLVPEIRRDDPGKEVYFFKNLEDKYITLPEYLEAAKETHENQVFYISDAETQAKYIQMFKDEGIDAIYLTHNIDNPYITMMEARDEKIKFARIDSEVS